MNCVEFNLKNSVYNNLKFTRSQDITNWFVQTVTYRKSVWLAGIF